MSTMNTDNDQTTVIIRPAIKEDTEPFLQLIQALADYEKLEGPGPEAQERLIKHAFDENPPLYNIFLAEVDGKIVGYAIFFFTYSSFLARPTLYLEDLFVLPEHRKKKIGHRLFTSITKHAHEKDCGRVEWCVLDWNQPAIDFYHRYKARHLEKWFFYRLDGEALEKTALLAK